MTSMPVYPSHHSGGIITILSPAGPNSLSAPRPSSLVMYLKLKGRLQFPTVPKYPREEYRERRGKLFDFWENDVLIISSGDSRENALKGGISAALYLNEEASKCGKAGWGCLTKKTDSAGLGCATPSVHEIIGRLPVTMRNKDCLGVREATSSMPVTPVPFWRRFLRRTAS